MHFLNLSNINIETSVLHIISNDEFPIFGNLKRNVNQNNILLFSPSKSSNSVSIQISNIPKNTSQNATFQYGRIATGNFRNLVVCKFQNFSTKMLILPSVKVTVDIGHGDNEIQRHTHAWLRNVSRDGFHVCYKEAYQLSGERNVYINYIAVAIPFIPYANDINDFKEQDYHIMRQNRSSLCQTIPLRHQYKTAPVVMASSVDVSNSQSNVPLVSWVKHINVDNFTICSKSFEDNDNTFTRDIHVGYFVYGNRTLCSYLQCPNHLECHVNSNKQVRLRKDKSCFYEIV